MTGLGWAHATALGQAYCALRDPVSMIYQAYPKADAYRSMTRTVGVEDRRAVGEVLPFTIHFDELGRHTLYVALQEGHPIGLLHVRSERGRYGLTEIAWSIGLDMTIQDVRIQRTRDAEMRRAVDDALREELRGKNIDSMRGKLPAGDSVDHADVIRRSAAKTLVVTDRIWNEDLRPYQAQLMVKSQWPDAHSDLEPLEVDSASITSNSGLQRPVYLWRVHSTAGEELGVVVWSAWNLDEQAAELWWIFDAEGVLQRIEPRRVRGDDVRAAFDQHLAGTHSTEACATAAGVATDEIRRVVTAARDRGLQ